MLLFANEILNAVFKVSLDICLNLYYHNLFNIIFFRIVYIKLNPDDVHFYSVFFL